jgi:hypothetical protein
MICVVHSRRSFKYFNSSVSVRGCVCTELRCDRVESRQEIMLSRLYLLNSSSSFSRRTSIQRNSVTV